MDGITDLKPAYLSILHADPADAMVQDLRHRFGGPVLLNTGVGTGSGWTANVDPSSKSRGSPAPPKDVTNLIAALRTPQSLNAVQQNIEPDDEFGVVFTAFLRLIGHNF